MDYCSRPLLCRSPLLPGESLPSLLLRLSEENKYFSPRTVERICIERLTSQDTMARPSRSETYDLLANLVRIDPNDLFSATVHRFASLVTPPTSKPKTIRLSSGKVVPLLRDSIAREHIVPEADVRYCPLCLKESPYHRVSWMVLAAPVCLRHHCLLQHQCPTCGKALSVRHLLGLVCPSCNGALTDVAPVDISADKFGLLCQSAIQSWMAAQETHPVADMRALSVYPAATLFRLLDGLRRAIMGIESHWDYLYASPNLTDCAVLPCTSKRQLTPTRTYLLYTTAFKGLMDWPQGFRDFLDAYSLRNRETAVGRVLEDFGRVYTWLERYWRPPAFDFVQQAFHEYLLEKDVLTPSMIHLQRAQPGLLSFSEFSTITEAEAARLLNTTARTIQRLVKQGVLKPYKQRENQDPTQTLKLLKRSDVVELRQKWHEAITLERAVQLLGVSKDVILQLVHAKLLNAVRGRSVDGSLNWKLSHQSIAVLIDDLRHKVVETVPDEAPNFVSLVEATQMLSGYGYNMVSIIGHLRNRELHGAWVGKHERLDQLRVSRKDIQDLAEAIRKKQSMIPRARAAKILGVKGTTVSKWAERGLIVPIETKGTITYFDRDAVEEFRRDHLFGPEAANILVVGELVVQKWARSGRLHPVSGPCVDGLHRYLFRRQDVERLRPEHRMTAPEMARQLGVSRRQIYTWIEKGRISPVSGPGVDGAKHYLFVLTQVEQTQLQTPRPNV